MINLEYIQQFYNNPAEYSQTKNIIKEYLQYNILKIIYDSSFGKKLYFLGGTAIRIIHNSSRFSEDLDFDNFGLTEIDFEKLTFEIKKGLELLGYTVEIKNIYKGAWHCNIKLPGILFDNNLSAYKEEKILIQIDTVKQDYIYKSDVRLLDKFGVYKMIKVAPISILLSKKIHALFGRKRLKGRDLYDIVFLYKFTKPDFDYLLNKIGIKNNQELKTKFTDFCSDLDLQTLSLDVKPFLINPDEVNRISSFREFVESL